MGWCPVHVNWTEDRTRVKDILRPVLWTEDLAQDPGAADGHFIDDRKRSAASSLEPSIPANASRLLDALWLTEEEQSGKESDCPIDPRPIDCQTIEDILQLVSNLVTMLSLIVVWIVIRNWFASRSLTVSVRRSRILSRCSYNSPPMEAFVCPDGRVYDLDYDADVSDESQSNERRCEVAPARRQWSTTAAATNYSSASGRCPTAALTKPTDVPYGAALLSRTSDGSVHVFAGLHLQHADLYGREERPEQAMNGNASTENCAHRINPDMEMAPLVDTPSVYGVICLHCDSNGCVSCSFSTGGKDGLLSWDGSCDENGCSGIVANPELVRPEESCQVDNGESCAQPLLNQEIRKEKPFVIDVGDSIVFSATKTGMGASFAVPSDLQSTVLADSLGQHSCTRMRNEQNTRPVLDIFAHLYECALSVVEIPRLELPLVHSLVICFSHYPPVSEKGNSDSDSSFYSIHSGSSCSWRSLNSSSPCLSCSDSSWTGFASAQRCV